MPKPLLVWLTLFSLLCGPIFTFVGWIGYRNTGLVPWVKTQGKITLSEAGQRAPKIRYEYDVNGKTRTGSLVMPLKAQQETGPEGAREIVARYPVGAEVPVYYDARNPKVAVLDDQVPLEVTLPLVVGPFFCILALACFVRLRRNHAAERAQPAPSALAPAQVDEIVSLQRKYWPLQAVLLIGVPILLLRSGQSSGVVNSGLLLCMAGALLPPTLEIQKRFGAATLGEAFEMLTAANRQSKAVQLQTAIVAVVSVVFFTYAMQKGWFPKPHQDAERSVASDSDSGK